MQGVFVKNYPAPPCDEREALRYAGWRGEADERALEEIYACYSECANGLSYRVCYVVADVEELKTLLGATDGAWMNARFSGAKQAVLFCATVGLEIDRLIQRYMRVSPTKALRYQALGTERIESLCDLFCEDIQKEFLPLQAGTRFSPGYGNVPLELQKTILEILDAPRKIGVSIHDSLLMSPSKSVTAFVPLVEKGEAKLGGCAVCAKTDCVLRKE